MNRQRRREVSDDYYRLKAHEIRGDEREYLRPMFWVTFITWLLSYFLFYFTTDMLTYQLEQIGLPLVLLGWFILSAAISAGYVIGYRIMLMLTGGNREFGEREVTALSLGDSVAAAGGGLLMSALPGVSTSNIYLYFLWVMVVGVFFVFSQLHPRYVARWREIAASRGH